MENLSSLNELDKTMLHYYGDTLSAANEELSKYTDHLESLTGVLDHYKTILELVGKKTNYDFLGTVL
jgi:hypothetical protein